MVAANRSAGILPYRMRDTVLEVFIGHMGGPFWAKKDARAWSVIKGLIEPGETELAAALREFAEETGNPAPAADYALLGEFRQSSGKRVTVFTAEIDELPPFPGGPVGGGSEGDAPHPIGSGWGCLRCGAGWFLVGCDACSCCEGP
jgi:8-oxo-dGTP pyrophosphatase MutT (NUDIX family)